MNRGRNNRGRFFRGRGFWFNKRGGGSKQPNRIPENGESEPARTPKAPQKQQTPLSFPIVTCYYQGWGLYHPEEGYIAHSNTAQKVKTMELYFQNNQHLFSMAAIEEAHTFTVDYKVLCSDVNVTASWKELPADLMNLPEHTINCIGLGMHQVLVNRVTEEMKSDQGGDHTEVEPINLPMIRARVVNFEPVIQLKHLKSNYFGKLVAVKGTIIRVGNMKLACTWMAFECNTCSTLQCVKQPEGVYTLPTSCNHGTCRSHSFTPLLSSPCTQTVNWQCVRLQEIVADEQREGGRVPRTIECELTADLVDSCSPGDVVTVTGIIKTRNTEEGSKRKMASVFLLYMDVVAVMNSKHQRGGGRAPVEFNLKDYYAIKEIHGEKQLFRLIVNSLCPSIYGHEVVKAGLVLCMFGGSQRHQDSRADPHILVVGDPGLGKSRMLQACANMAPRGVYVCGNTSTTSGLTVTLNREGGGDYALEAGALVLSDQGCCCIDEFDKMSTQHQALLEAMEQQTISIAKAGVVCSLPARTSILAAANPIGGHYNKAKTVSENLKIGPALLSRFDLVFILLDLPNEKLDRMLSEHVMGQHSGMSFTSSASSICSTTTTPTTLKERLQLLPGEEVDFIPHQLLRKYIAYARKYVKPKLCRQAARVIQKFYLELRRLHQSADSTPITTRQLESLIRLSEARAKLELREEVTEQDALDVVEIFKNSLIDTFADECGMLDFKRSQHGSGMSSRNQAKKFISILQKRAELQSRSVFTVQELKDVAKNASLHMTDFNAFLSTLNVQGFLLKKGSQLYQLLSADY